jgi:hypothetical protein
MFSTPVTKFEGIMKIPSLFNPEDLPPRIRYEKLFKHLPAMEEMSKVRGRPSFPKDAILRALIYRNLRGLASLADLAFELENNPMMAEVLGFPAFQRPPSKERFSCFLRTTVNRDLQCIRLGLVRALKDEKVISGHIIALDSSAIEANVRENNLKTAVKDRFDKSRRLKGDPDARLGVEIHYPKPFKRKIEFFWGYRNHMINDTDSELPIHEVTYPVYWGKKYQGQYLLCPIGHPKFFKQKGCNHLIRLSPSVRDTIDYGSLSFKKIYNQRSSVERVFSRLLVLAMQKPTIVRLQATKNHCTIAHITVLLVALAAHRMGFTDKIRYVKSFLPRYLCKLFL